MWDSYIFSESKMVFWQTDLASCFQFERMFISNTYNYHFWSLVTDNLKTLKVIVIRGDSKFEMGDGKCLFGVNLWTLLPPMDNVHTQNSHFYLPYVLTISFISPIFVCSVGNPFKMKSLSKFYDTIYIYTYMWCCHTTFKY